MGKTYEALMQADKERLRKAEGMDIESSRGLPLPSHVEIPYPVVEEYHRMEFTISNQYPDKRNKTFMFVSSKEGEGNSTVLTHFGITMACRGKRVLLVDMNLRHPSIHRSFGLPVEMGFVDWILGEKCLEEVLKQTSLKNLQVITSGEIPLNAFPIHSFLSSDFPLEPLKSKADWILIDGPPVSASGDSIALAAKVDGVILVIRAEKTRWEVAQNARERIESGRGNIIGVILNGRRFYVPGWLYRRLG